MFLKVYSLIIDHYVVRIVDHYVVPGTVEVVVYILRTCNQYIFTELNKNNNEGKRSGGTTGAGVADK